MKALKKFFDVVKPVFKRFPVLIFMGFVAAVFFSLWANSSDFFSTFGVDYDSEAYRQIAQRRLEFEEICSPIFRVSLISMLASIFLQLLFERLRKRKEFLGKNKLMLILPQILALLVFVPCFFIFRSTDNEYSVMAYLGLLLILAVFSFTLVLWEQKNDTFPNCIISWVIASITATCMGTGLMLIRLAIQLLLKNTESFIGFQTMLIVTLSFFVVFAGVFTACVTKNTADISIPKVFKAIVLYALVPLYLILILILYIYLVKSLLTWTMPSGRINPLVSAATAIYLLFYFSIRRYEESRFARIFCSWGVVILYPLIAVQCMAFGIRIHHYGFTSPRYLSLIYILFSILFCVLPIVRSGKYMSCTFPVLAALVLISTMGPLNALDMPQKNQLSRLEKVFKRHGLLEDGKIAAEKASSVFSNEEKSLVVSAYREIDFDGMAKKPRWYEDGMEWSEKNDKASFSFEKAFGFKYSDSYDKDFQEFFSGYSFECSLSKHPLDVSRYKTLRSFYSSHYYDRGERELKVIVKYSGGKEIDITDFIRSRAMQKESRYDSVDKTEDDAPIIMEAPDGKLLLFTDIYYSAGTDEDGEEVIYDWRAEGYEAELLD